MILYYYTILSYQQYSSTFNIDLFFTCCVFTATIRDNDENVYEWGDKCKWLPRDASKNWKHLRMVRQNMATRDEWG